MLRAASSTLHPAAERLASPALAVGPLRLISLSHALLSKTGVFLSSAQLSQCVLLGPLSNPSHRLRASPGLALVNTLRAVCSAASLLLVGKMPSVQLEVPF